MKITKFIVLAFLITSCGTVKYNYQLVELDSRNMQQVGNSLQSSNNDIDVNFNFWGNGGKSSFTVKNKTNKMLYIKHDECFLIKNGNIIDYYDNSEYTNSSISSSTSSKSASKSNIYNSENMNTAFDALGSMISASKTVAKTKSNSSGVTKSDKKILPVPPNSYRKINGYTIQYNRLRDCNVDIKPSKKKSNKENGVVYDQEDTPMNLNILITYAFEEDFKNKKSFEISTFIKHFSNWHEDAFIVSEKYKECEDDIFKKNRDIYVNYSPLMWFHKYRKQ